MTPQPGLADVLTSAAAGLGVSGFSDVLGFGEVQHAVVCLIDGLGWNLLREYGEHAPTLTAASGYPIASVFPTTTPSALGSMGTGLLPGAHGLVGASFLLPETNQVLWPLKWKSDASPIAVQPEPTIFEIVARHGVVRGVVHQGRLMADNLHLAPALRHPHDDAGSRQFSRCHPEVLFAAFNRTMPSAAVAMWTKLVAAAKFATARLPLVVVRSGPAHEDRRSGVGAGTIEGVAVRESRRALGHPVAGRGPASDTAGRIAELPRPKPLR